jgi:hypothetical protein
MECLETMVMGDISIWANELNQDTGIKFLSAKDMIDAYWAEKLDVEESNQ